MSITNSSASGGLLNETVSPALLKKPNFTLGPNHSASLTFDASRKDFRFLAPVVAELFRMDVFSIPLVCVYPISGQYGFANRLIYYVLLIFSLILRRYEYLSIAALGTCMTYATVACVHAFCLLVRYKYKYSVFDYKADPDIGRQPPTNFGDLDLLGIYPILVAGCIMLTPILNWSTTVRKSNASVIIKYWGILMFTALIAVLSKVLTLRVFPFMFTGLATCHLDPKKNCTIDEIMASKNVSNFMSFQDWRKCNCNDTCGTLDFVLPFRKSTSMQAFLASDEINKILLEKEANRFFLINILCLLAIIVQGIFGLMVGRWHPAVVRNWIFRLLSGAQERPGRVTLLWKCRYYISKMSAGTIYMGAICAAVICPIVFISSVVINEFIVHSYPSDERYDAIGQWSTWIGAGSVVLAAVIRQYHSAWILSAKLGFSTTIRIVKWIFGKAELRAEPIRAERNKDNSAIEDLKDFFKQCIRPLKHVWRSMCHAGQRIVLEWRDLTTWYKDPIERSQQPRMHEDLQMDAGEDVEPESQDRKSRSV